jgi:AcrR family transcriptional regulator
MSQSRPKTRRERRVARRKAQILDAAAQVFAEKGFHRTTTRDIAEAADIAEGTIYNYFGSKDDLLLGLINRLADLEDRRRLYEESLDEDARAFLSRHLVDRFTVSRQAFVLLQAILPEILSTPALREQYLETIYEPALRLLEGHFQARVERGQLRDDLDVRLTVRLLACMLLGVQMALILGDEELLQAWENPGPLVETLIGLVFDPLEGEADGE